jgi:hypothetical protein
MPGAHGHDIGDARERPDEHVDPPPHGRAAERPSGLTNAAKAASMDTLASDHSSAASIASTAAPASARSTAARPSSPRARTTRRTTARRHLDFFALPGLRNQRRWRLSWRCVPVRKPTHPALGESNGT